MKKTILLKAAIITVAALAILAAALLILRHQDREQYAEHRGTMEDGFGELKTVTWNGVEYREKPAVTTILVAGVDRAETVENSNSYRDGGQADFLLLLCIDHTDKKIYQLQIDRDTMAEVVVLGVFGNEVGTRIYQICLAHSFGNNPQDNAQYTVRAVENLLGGIQIDGYYMFNYSVVPTLNDALGGIQVKINYDMEHLNPAWTKGSTVTLHGREAETFVRARMVVGSGTNVERMDRQNEFIRSLIKTLNRKISANLSFGEQFVETMQQLSTTNMTAKWLADELNQSYRYELQEVEHLDGEHTTGDDGYHEFHLKDGAAVEWVLDHLYTKK